MSQIIQIQIPEGLLGPLQRMAQATRRPLEEVVVAALQASLPSLDGLPAPIAEELSQLETLDDAELRRILLENVPVAVQDELADLLADVGAGTLDEPGRARLAVLQRDADRVMLRKGRAAVLLRFRGQRLPTLDEMRRLDTAAE
jgi:hypothetical protein